MDKQFYHLADAILMSATIALDLQHLHRQLTVDRYFVSATFASILRNLMFSISCRIVASRLRRTMDVTPRRRTENVALHEHTAKTQREIAALVDVSLATVSRVIKLKQDTRLVSPKPAMSNANVLLSKKLYHYLNQSRTMNDILMRVAPCMAYFYLSKLNSS